MNRETRRMRGGEVRAAEEDGQHFITLRVVTPGVVDDYGSVWMADCFDASCAERMPTLAWGHQWTEPIGRGVEYTPDPGGPLVRFRLDDFDAVPLARRAYAQVLSGTIDDCSVGFSNTDRREATDADIKKWPGCREVITRSDLDETSLVLRGAVPGAKVVGVRMRNGTRTMVDTDLVVELAKKVSAGDLTEDEAQVALTLAAGDPVEPENGTDEDEDDETLAAAEAAADAALDDLDGWV